MIQAQVAKMHLEHSKIAIIANALPNAYFKSLRIHYSDSDFSTDFPMLSYYSISNHAAMPIASWK